MDTYAYIEESSLELSSHSQLDARLFHTV